MDAAIDSWKDLGARVARARKAARLSQAELANAMEADRTVITKMESGDRRTTALELARMAKILGRGIDWFLLPSPPAFVSRRNEREADESEADVLLEQVARDVELLVELKLLSPLSAPTPTRIDSVEAAEQAAASLRTHLELGDGPVWNLSDIATQVGLFGYVLPLLSSDLDGSYVRLQTAGVAVVNGKVESGRRRFTFVHELGHHLFADDYSTEWIIGDSGKEREKLINAFAIHFLMPRSEIASRWAKLGGSEQPRRAALHLATGFGTSWTAAVAHLRNLDIIDAQTYARLRSDAPRKADYVEECIAIREDLTPPVVPSPISQGAIRGFRGHKLSRGRVLELLRGTLLDDDLPADSSVPVESMVEQLRLD